MRVDIRIKNSLEDRIVGHPDAAASLKERYKVLLFCLVKIPENVLCFGFGADLLQDGLSGAGVPKISAKVCLAMNASLS